MAVKDTASGARVKAGSFSPPSSYTTGGITVDLTADFSWLGFVALEVETAGSLPPVHFEWAMNSPANGKATVKIMRDRFDKATLGNVTGNPSGTTVQAAKAATGTTTGSSHTHTMNHDHPIATSSAPVGGGDGVDAEAMQPAIAGHTHSVDVANFTGSTGSQTHTHNRSFEYEHGHALASTTETNAASVEIANGTNLSTTVFRYFAAGF